MISKLKTNPWIVTQGLVQPDASDST